MPPSHIKGQILQNKKNSKCETRHKTMQFKIGHNADLTLNQTIMVFSNPGKETF